MLESEMGLESKNIPGKQCHSTYSLTINQWQKQIPKCSTTIDFKRNIGTALISPYLCWACERAKTTLRWTAIQKRIWCWPSEICDPNSHLPSSGPRYQSRLYILNTSRGKKGMRNTIRKSDRSGLGHREEEERRSSREQLEHQCEQIWRLEWKWRKFHICFYLRQAHDGGKY